MVKSTFAVLVAAFLVMSTGCDQHMVANEGAIEVSASFERVRPGSDAVPKHAAFGVADSIVLNGALGTPHLCPDQDFNVRARWDSGRVVVEIDVDERAACITVPATYAYSIALRPFERGSHEVKVMHHHLGQHPYSYTAYHDDVLVW